MAGCPNPQPCLAHSQIQRSWMNTRFLYKPNQKKEKIIGAKFLNDIVGPLLVLLSEPKSTNKGHWPGQTKFMKLNLFSFFLMVCDLQSCLTPSFQEKVSFEEKASSWWNLEGGGGGCLRDVIFRPLLPDTNLSPAPDWPICGEKCIK